MIYFTYLSNKYLSNAYYLPVTDLDIRNIAVSQNSSPDGLLFSGRDTENK